MNIFNSTRSKGTTTINGRTYPAGSSVQISGNGNVVIDGVQQAGAPLVGPVTVTIEGDAEYVESTSGNVTVKGKCTTASTVSGDVHCGDIGGDVSTVNGNVTAKAIAGRVSTVNGDVRGAR